LLKTQEPDNVTVPQPKEHAFPVGLSKEPAGAEMHVMGSMNNSLSPTEGPTATGQMSFTPERMDAANNFAWDMISLGLEEPFPAREVIDELYVCSRFPSANLSHSRQEPDLFRQDTPVFANHTPSSVHGSHGFCPQLAASSMLTIHHLGTRIGCL
jgi:hypothetical protein